MENNQNLLTFGELYQTYKERFLRLAISYVKEESIAEDFVTDSFVSYWEELIYPLIFLFLLKMNA